MNEEIFSKFFKIIIYIYFAFTGFLIQAKSTPTKNPLSVSEYLPISIEEEILFTKDSSVITVPHSFAGKRLRFFNSIEITVKINSEKNINLSSKIKGIIPPDNSYFFTESVISKGGNPYLLSSDNCIHYYKNQKQRKIKIKKPISTIAAFKDNKILVGTSQGLFSYDLNNLSSDGVPEILQESKITSMYTNEDYDVWGSFQNSKTQKRGVFLCSGSKFDFYSLSEFTQLFLTDTCHKVSGKPDYQNIYKLINDIMFDKVGNIWFSTEKGEVYRFAKNTRSLTKMLPVALPSSNITSVKCFDNEWFVGTDNGLTTFNGMEWDLLKWEEVIDIQKSHDGNMFLLSNSKIKDIKNNEDIPLLFSKNQDIKIALDKNEVIWLIQDGVLKSYSKGYWFEQEDVKNINEKLESILFDGHNLWVGGNRSLYKKVNGEWKKFGFPGNIASNHAKVLCAYNAGIIIGTDMCLLHFKEGIFKELTENSRFDIINVRKGIHNDIWFQFRNKPIENVNLETGESLNFGLYYWHYDIDDFCLREGTFDIDIFGNLLIGGECGLRYYNIKYNKIDSIGKKDKPSIDKLISFPEIKREKNKQVLSIDEAKAGEIIWRSRAASASYEALPVLHDDALLIPGYLGDLYCMDLETGKENWRNILSKKENEVSPTTCLGKVFMANENLKIYDINSGKLLSTLSDNPCALGSTDSSVVFFEKKSLSFYDARDFTKRKEISLEYHWSGDYWILSDSNRIWLLGNKLWYCYSKKGFLLWEQENSYEPPHHTRPARPFLYKDLLYLSRGNNLLKVDASNGILLKEFKNEKPVFYPFASKEVEVYSTLYSNICCYDFGGELRWKKKISVMATPVIADTIAVYGSSNYGEVSAYDIKTGKELWTAKIRDGGGLLFIGIYKELLIAVFEGGRTVAVKR